MKRFLAVLTALALVLCVAAAGFAAGDSFEIGELHMSVTIPGAGNMALFTRDGAQNGAADDFLAESGATDADMQAYMLQNGLYLSAMDPDTLNEISISSLENKDTKYLYDMDDLDAEEVQMIVDTTGSLDVDENVPDEMKNSGATWMEGGTMNFESAETLNGHAYIAMSADGNMEEIPTWVTGYYTVKNGRAIYIRYISYDGPATQEQKEMLREIAQSAEYVKIPPAGKTYAKEKASAGNEMLWRVLTWVIIAGVIALVSGLTARAQSRKKKQAMQAQAMRQAGNPQGFQPGMQNPAQQQGPGAQMQAVRPPQSTVQPPQGIAPPPQGTMPPQGIVQPPQPTAGEPVFPQQDGAPPVQGTEIPPVQGKQDLLAKLEYLREQGLLTQEEYEQKKAELERRAGESRE